MKIKEIFFLRACRSEESFLVALDAVRENERERLLEQLLIIERDILKYSCLKGDIYTRGVTTSILQFKRLLKPKS